MAALSSQKAGLCGLGTLFQQHPLPSHTGIWRPGIALPVEWFFTYMQVTPDACAFEDKWARLAVLKYQGPWGQIPSMPEARGFSPVISPGTQPSQSPEGCPTPISHLPCLKTPSENCPELKLFSHVQLFAIPWTVAYQTPPSMQCSRQEYWSGLPFPSPVQSLSRVRLFVTPWTAARQASLSITNSWSPPKPMSIESVMPSNHLILCRPLLLPSIFPSIRVFSNESALPIRWPKYWSFSFNISPSNEHPGLISFRMDWSPLGWTGWISLQSKGLSRVFSNTTVQKHQFLSAQLSL